jgi:YfiH family protein
MAAEVLKSALLGNAGFSHGFATRRGGVSPAPFDSLNFRVSGSETSDRIDENLRRFADAVGFAASDLHLVDQVHGASVYIAEGEPTRTGARPQADAIILADGKIGGVRVADCVPILVADLVTGRAAAIHAGWRGIESGVIGAALAALGDSRSMRVAAIGPCIGPCCFEVGGDVADRIAGAAGTPDVIVRREGDKAWADLRLAARAQLHAHGLPSSDIEAVGGCTKCDAASFFSFRRDGELSGRHLAVIRARAAGGA